MSSAREAWLREEARLIILKALAGETDETLSSSMLERELRERFGIKRERSWVHGELDWLAEHGAVALTEAGTVKIAVLTAKGQRHLDREIAIEGVRRPSRPEA
ncbi:hypothetical protein OSH11_21630 [Kaistia dalseonensis]|uniref:Repressor of nif and glnA expression n=1 Tax=Kaistia dalseonensis TaxID=410840 RepID=A0ABU0HCF5_9HYPH|nr:hypothetical protein [Kaistia dalseonensis]MCX5497313.1 hypothetical protein [Kaistia dalseonensis]MDQ0439950.1 repressor of nif and glnA expression [Kaistia dalseonensis]